ncbi:MAG: ABC transporter ATP-binding protein [Treponema sp.]
MTNTIHTNESFLAINRLTKQRGQKTISLSFSLAKGESLALLGPSGCGKSTILSMIAGLLSPDSGTIMLNGTDITALPAAKRHIGMVFQDYALFPHLTVEDNIGYGLVSAGMTKKESRAAAAEWIQRFGLHGMEKRPITFLSGGEKQRVALARTLAVNPLAVLFDEPLSALDTELRIKLRAELQNHQKDIGYTAIYVTHDREEASVLAHRIIEMKQPTPLKTNLE